MNLNFLLSHVSADAVLSLSQRGSTSLNASDDLAPLAFSCSPVSSGELTTGSSKMYPGDSCQLRRCDELLDTVTLESRDADERNMLSVQSSFNTGRRRRTVSVAMDYCSEGGSRKFGGAYTVLPRASQGATASKGSPGPTVSNKLHRCFCGRVFNKREHLKRHDLLVHKDFRPFSCKDCSIRFGTKQNYQVHMTTNKHRQRIHFNMAKGGVGGRNELEQGQVGGASMHGEVMAWSEAMN